MHLSSRVCRKFLVLVLGAVVISALAAGPALAKGPTRSSGNAVCFVTPNPVSNDVNGATYTVVGAGFQAGMQLSIFVGTGTILMAVADSTGSFASWDWAQTQPNGTTDVYVYRAGDRRMTVLAHCSFLVS